MSGKQHMYMGVSCAIGVLTYASVSGNNLISPLASVSIVIGTMFPDIDHDNSKLGKKRKEVFSYVKIFYTIVLLVFLGMSFYSGGIGVALLNLFYILFITIIVNIVKSNDIIKKQMGFLVKHRGIMHTLIPPILLVALTYWTDNDVLSDIIVGFFIGYVVHLLGDMSTEQGVPILYPISKKNIRYLKLNSTRHHNVLNLVCFIWCLVFIIGGFYLGIRRV